MGGLDNFESVIPKLADNGYRVIGPVLPLLKNLFLKQVLNTFRFYKDFLKFKNLKKLHCLVIHWGSYFISICRDYPKWLRFGIDR